MLPFIMRRSDRISWFKGKLLSDLLVQSVLPRRLRGGGRLGGVGGNMNDP